MPVIGILVASLEDIYNDLLDNIMPMDLFAENYLILIVWS